MANAPRPQGCCISRPSGPNSPYPGGVGADASARAINDEPQQVTTASALQQAPDSSLPSSPASERPRRHGHRQHHSDQPLGQHINRPLRRHEWIMSRGGGGGAGRVWTRASLARERAEFFDTRVAGRQEVWQALRAALELMWEADTAARDSRVRQQGLAEPATETEVGVTTSSGEQRRAAALATAQTILSAAEITLPTGDLANGAYDAFGNYYSFPEHVVADPINISLAEEGDGDGDSACGDVKGGLTAGEETADKELGGDEEAVRRREEKGKAVVDMRDQVTLRARLSEGDRDVTLSVGRGESVRSVARRIAEEALVSPSFRLSRSHLPFPVNCWLTNIPPLEAARHQEDSPCVHGQDPERGLVPPLAGLEAGPRRQRAGVQQVATLDAGRQRRHGLAVGPPRRYDRLVAVLRRPARGVLGVYQQAASALGRPLEPQHDISPLSPRHGACQQGLRRDTRHARRGDPGPSRGRGVVLIPALKRTAH